MTANNKRLAKLERNGENDSLRTNKILAT